MESTSSSSDKPRRHGCLTAFLIFMIAANTITALTYILNREVVRATLPSATHAALLVLAVGGMSNVICALGLLWWKKWGFYGCAVTAFLVFRVNLSIGIPFIPALFGLAGIGILYGTLQLGGEDKAWTHLE